MHGDQGRRPAPRRRLVLVATAVAGLTLAAYANHFQNGFHFDDSHAIVENTFVRDVANIPRYFVDATTFSVLALNQSYRPVLQTTLAIDYRIGGGYRPVIFQIDSFVWFALQLLCMWGLYSRLLGTLARHGHASAPSCSVAATWPALLAVSLYAVHPVGAETVNYIVQRGEILSTLGAVSALWMYAASARARRWHLWVVPLAFGALAKPPALVFPVILTAYALLIERPAPGPERRAAVRTILVSIFASMALAGWIATRTPASYTTGGGEPWRYWLTQGWVTTRYLAAFFAPIHLSADHDYGLVAGWNDARAWMGIATVAMLGWAAIRTGRRRETAPVAFGIAWFLVALLPTALVPLAEVANDHRMYFPYVGLALAVTWGARLLVALLPDSSPLRSAIPPVIAVLLVAGAVGVRARNEVWRSDESLWLDVTRKSPRNGRGWMNYGLARMEQGDYATAIDSYERARALTPAYPLVYINLGIAYGATGRAADAERAFLQAQQLAPNDWRSQYYYARWLGQQGRTMEALTAAAAAVSQNPADEASRALLNRLRAGTPDNADGLVALSLAEWRAGRYRESLASAMAALKLRPGYAEAYNNVAAAHIAMGEWDAGILAATEALRLKPDLQIARENLLFAYQQKARAVPSPPGKPD